MIDSRFKKNAGFTLIEAMVYFAILLVISVAVVSVIISYGGLLAELRVRVLVSETAQSTLERITREIRNADAVDPFGTIDDTADGKLILTNIDADDVEFDLNNKAIELTEGASLPKPITSSEVEVDDFWVHRYINADTELVRVSFTLVATSSRGVVREAFHSGAVLRGSYD